jgi:subtilisin family serine protease
MKPAALALSMLMSCAVSAVTTAQKPSSQGVFDKAVDRREPSQSVADVLLWQSAAATQQDLPRDLASLYQILHRFSALPITQYVDAIGRPVATILRERQLVFGAHFPVETDRVLCSLNRHVCRLSESGSVPVWSNKAGDTLTLPALTFTVVRVLQGYKLAGKQDVKSLVRARNGCDSYDDSCWALIERLNGATLDELNRQDSEVIVPALTVRTALPRAVPSAARAELAHNLVATAIFKQHSAPPEQDPLFGQQRDVFALIGHPFASGDVLRDCSTVHVGVIDNEFGQDGIPSHCDFRADSAPGVCGQPGVARMLDHGTHVAGIIAARQNGRGIVGMTPTVKLHTEKYVSGLDGNTAELEQVIGKLRGEGVDVFNMSFGYTNPSSARDDRAEAAIRTLRRLALFVAAAGNDGQDKSGVCDIRPACLGRELNNVISVVAIDRDPAVPDLWSDATGSSNSGQVFDIAAPGANILSTLVDGGVAVMSGTSQAAPMVASAAALLLAIDDKLRPVEIKHRLIATSDFLPSLAGKVFGGRLNVKRAIDDLETDVFESYDGPVTRGLLADNTHRVKVLKEDGSPDSILTASILRWVCDDAKVCTFVFQDSSSKKLTKWVNATVTDGTGLLRVKVDGKLPSLKVTSIRDFTAAIRDDAR